MSQGWWRRLNLVDSSSDFQFNESGAILARAEDRAKVPMSQAMQCALCLGRLAPVDSADLRRLAAAIIVCATDDVMGNLTGEPHKARDWVAIRNEARRWFRSDQLYLFSYAMCCQILGVPQGRFRDVVERYVERCGTTVTPLSVSDLETCLAAGE